MNQKIAVITVVYNNYDDLPQFFSSFNKQTDKNFHIYIADLSSKPKNVTFPHFVTLFKDKNKGYAYGINRGVEKAQKDGCTQFAGMNNDIIVDKDLIKNISKTLQEHSGSLIGGKIYYYPGYEYHTERYRKNDLGYVLWYAGGKMDWKNATATHRGVDEVDKGQYNKFEKTEFVTGCLMVFDQLLLDQAGKMDDSYFMYYEDTDWNQKVLRSGCKIYYDPSLIIWHKNAQSTGGSGSSLHEKYLSKNQLKFGLRYAPFRTKVHLVKNYFLKKILFR